MGYLIFLFIAVPFAELAILIKVGQVIGTANTLLIVILTGVWGAYLAKLQGLLVLQRLQRELNSGQMPQDSLFDGVIILCCGLLLITPGIVTDAVGFLGLIPQTRNIFKRWIKDKFADMLRDGRVITIKS